MDYKDLFAICFFGTIALGVFMFFLLGIIEDICNYKLAKSQKDKKDAK